MSATDMFWQAPPITRTLAAATFTLSLLVYSGIVPIDLVLFDAPVVFNFPPHIWRIFTSFMITGNGLSIIFDTYFLYNYGSKLEKSSPRLSKPGDFLAYLLFVSFVIVGLNVLVTGGDSFTTALGLAFAYTSTQDDRGHQATFFILTVPAQWIPYFMLLMTLVTNGPIIAMVQATGLIAAHLHDFLTRIWPRFGGGKNLLETPAILKRLAFTRRRETSYGTGQAASGGGSSEGYASGVLPEAWKTRGSGHRLGGS